MYETPQHPHVFNLSTISEHPPPTERDSSTSEDSTDYVIANERQIEDRQRPEPKERDTRPLPLPLPPRSNTTRRAQIQNAGNAAPSRSNQPSDENPDDAGDSRAGGEPGLPAASYSSAGRAGSTHRNLGLVHRTRDRTSQTAREGGAGVGQSEEERVVGGDGRGGGLRRARLEEVARRALEVERRGTRGQD